MIWFKSCPRCQGDLLHRTDSHGPYVSCLQCGRHFGDAEAKYPNQVQRRQVKAKTA